MSQFSARELFRESRRELAPNVSHTWNEIPTVTNELSPCHFTVQVIQKLAVIN